MVAPHPERLDLVGLAKLEQVSGWTWVQFGVLAVEEWPYEYKLETQGHMSSYRVAEPCEQDFQH